MTRQIRTYLFTHTKRYFAKLYILLFSSVFIAGSASAQQISETTLGETGLWNGVYIKAKLTDKIGYYAEHHYRVRNAEDNINSFVGRRRQIYNRAGINILFNPNFEAVIGPTLVFNYTPSPGNPNFEKVTLEPRIWHQWLFSMPAMGPIKVYHQFRFEHRWKRDNSIESPLEYTNRYRYKLFSYIPINSPYIKPKTIYFSPSAEIFMHSGKSIVFHPFEDFRIYNGIGYVVNEKLTFFAGHMWTIGQRPTGFQYRTSHIFRINMLIGLDLRKIQDKIPSINLGY